MAMTTYLRSTHSFLSLSAGELEEEAFEPGQVCIPNISTRERRKRLHSGLIQLGFSLVVLTALVVRGMNRWWRLPLLLSFWGATAGFFQWRDKT